MLYISRITNYNWFYVKTFSLKLVILVVSLNAIEIFLWCDSTPLCRWDRSVLKYFLLYVMCLLSSLFIVTLLSWFYNIRLSFLNGNEFFISVTLINLSEDDMYGLNSLQNRIKLFLSESHGFINDMKNENAETFSKALKLLILSQGTASWL